MKPTDDSPDGPDLRPEIPPGILNFSVRRRALYISEYDLGIISALMAVGMAFAKGDLNEANKHLAIYTSFRLFHYSTEEFRKLLDRLSTLNEEFDSATNESL